MKKKVKDEEFQKMKRVPHKRNKYVDKSFHFYFSFMLRIILMFGSILVIGYFSYVCFRDSFTDGEDEKISYKESADLKSNVIYLDHNLFETGQLISTDSYYSDYIDDISSDFSYHYELDKEVDIKYTYNVVATTTIKDKNGTIVSEKKDKIVNDTTKEEADVKEININQNVNLDYDSYNNLAKSFNQQIEQYGNITGNVNLRMNISIEIDYDKFDNKIEKESYIDVPIDLLSTNVTIKIANDISNGDTFVEHHNPQLINKFSLYSGISLLIMDTIFFLLALSFIFKARPKKSKYCILRDGLLRDYGKIIVNSKKIPKLSDYNIIDCYSFSELMDAQKLLGKPIIYYEIVKNQKCIFVLIGDNDIYTFTLKECDIDF